MSGGRVRIEFNAHGEVGAYELAPSRISVTHGSLRALYDEAYDLRGSLHVNARKAIAEEIVWRWDCQLRANQTLLACLRVLRETNPQSKGGRRAA
jgi:hypothetical protein